ncbi:MAG: hypothetical protein PQJ60_07595 [Spirochaetales bacterium]|nr:hypothetical protein [Spirochaetales bacterium]
MTEKELQAYADRCSDELEDKQKELQKKYELTGRNSYELDWERMVLRIETGPEVFREFAVILIGSLAPVSKNWLWAWANESLDSAVRDRSARLKALYDETGFDLFRTGTFKADGNLAREISALAVHHLGAAGLYRVPGGKDQDKNILIHMALFPRD